jgi:arylsulfatase A-like enzyme
MRTLLLSLLLVASAFGQPNIIVILVDDLGVGDVGFSGGKDFPTPHLDQLAAEGCRFSHAYVNPMCSPTRAALMTGLYPQRFGIEDNRPLDGELTGMDTSQVLLPERLRMAGYHTRLIGKWHLGKGANDEFAPLNRGFDEFFGYYGAAGKYVDPTLYRNREAKPHTGYITDLLTAEACTFLQQNHAKPFFLHLAHMAAHHPQQPRESDLARVPSLQGKRRSAGAIISNLDDSIGLLMKTLKETGLEQNTLVIFTSDNGGEPPVLGTNNGPHRGQKFDVWEGGIRVPFAIRWPGQVAAGGHYEWMIHIMDVVPTCLAAAGKDASGFDGVDLMPVVLGKAQGAPHPSLCWQVGEHAEWRIAGRDTNLARKLCAIRSGTEKLIMLGNDAPQLFDLSTDPGEEHDLATQHPERVTALRSTFDAWRAQMIPQIIAADHPIYGTGKKPKGKAKAR